MTFVNAFTSYVLIRDEETHQSATFCYKPVGEEGGDTMDTLVHFP